MLSLEHPRVSSRWPCHHVASNLLLLRRRRWGALQHHGGGMVGGWKVAGIRSWSTSVPGRLLRQSHVTELGVKGVGLRVEVIGLLLLGGGMERLLRGFPLLRVPASSRGEGSRVINNSAAIGVDERLSCVWVDQNTARWYP